MNLRDELQRSLGDAFVIERELTGGGMSRVFLARDAKLERNVVIKVLPPQLAAGVPAERFEREIKLAAGLQHPHIVPVLSAGAAGELLYYVMPHIAGQSLAERLQQDGVLPAAEAARVLRDVADALAYAHSKGIVHRDIKPANVLLSDKHGMVTDFGVAKALGTGDTKLTGTGFALGTRAYMSPEQASADPEADHRTDIYAFGVLAYEALTGALPPSAVPDRSTLPPSLADLVTRCLSPDPAARPQTAAELVAALETGGAPTRPKKPRSMPEITLIAVAVLISITAVIAILRGGTAPTSVDPNVVAIMPFRVAGADSGLHYLREGMMDLLAARLTGEGGPRAADPQSVMSAWRRRGGTESEDIPQQAANDLAVALGAGEVLTGGIVGSGGQLTITAAIVDAIDGTSRALSTVVGPIDSVAVLVDRLASQLLVSSALFDEVYTRSIDALKAYLAGRAAYRRGDYEGAARHLERALRYDSTFTQAAVWLVCATGWNVPSTSLQQAEQVAWAGRDKLPLRDRARLEAMLGPRYPEPLLGSEALAAAERAVEAARDNPDAWYLFGDAYFHDGAYLGYEDHVERARAALDRAFALDSGFADPLGHLIELAANRGDTVELRHLSTLYLGMEGARRGSYSLRVRWHIGHFLGDTALQAEVRHALDTATVWPADLLFSVAAAGAHEDVDSILAIRARRATTRAEQIRAADERMTVRLNQGRVREVLGMVDAATRAGARFAPVIQIWIWRRSGIGDSAAVAELVRELARFTAGPQPDDPETLYPYVRAIALLGEWATSNGDAVGAGRAAARLRTVPREAVAIARYAAVWAELLDGQAAALRGQVVARTHADRADSLLKLGANLPRPAIENLALAQLYDAVGETGQALAAVRRGSPQGYNHLQSWLWREEARLAARAGEREAALAAYERAFRILSHPDPEIVASFEAVKREIEAGDH